MTHARLIATRLLLGALCVATADARAAALQDARAVERILEAGARHLGNDRTPDWTEAPSEPEAVDLELRFESPANAGEWVLLVEQRHVSDAWSLALNGRRIARLVRHDDRRLQRYRVPAGALVDGENLLAVAPERPGDDITFGPVRLVETSLRALLDLRTLRLEVREQGSGRPLPARLTLRRAEDDAPAEIYDLSEAPLPLRPGLVYLADRPAEIEAPAGRLRVYASRGVEWSVASAEIDLRSAAEPVPVRLELRREVATEGLVAVDTHVHTVTHSGHGDATLDERMVSLAAEGVELAIATDHNHNTDYRPAQRAAGLDGWFTPVTGNEVTTENGHFNAFPLRPDGPLPAHDLDDWVALVQGMRSAGARCVVLNHPRWPAWDTGPFGRFGLDVTTGERASGTPFTFDAMELVNATDRHDDPLALFRDWFALLGKGERIVAVGSSDSHTLVDPVGMGRTYAFGADLDVARLDVESLADAVAAGRSTISLGLLADARLDGLHGPGAIASLAPDAQGRRRGRLAVRVAAPSWARPRSLSVFFNGAELAARALEPSPGRPFDAWLEFDVEPARDGWLVAVVLGDAVDGPWWPSVNAYTLAATNPIWIDADGDGASAPR